LLAGRLQRIDAEASLSYVLAHQGGSSG
jgi:hypothetical protein